MKISKSSADLCTKLAGYTLIRTLTVSFSSYLPFPALHFVLMGCCPNRIEFSADSWSLYAGLLFCPLQDLVWQKWFSTPSWLTSHGLIEEFGNFESLIFTMALKPWVIDWRSNHSLLEMNSLPLGKATSPLQFEKKVRKASNLLIRTSSLLTTASLLELKNSMTSPVWLSKFILASSVLLSSPFPERCLL